MPSSGLMQAENDDDNRLATFTTTPNYFFSYAPVSLPPKAGNAQIGLLPDIRPAVITYHLVILKQICFPISL